MWVMMHIRVKFCPKFFYQSLTVKNVFSIYDISEETPIEPTTTSTNNNMDDRYATKEELKQVEAKLTSKMDANKADIDAKLEKMNAKIDANHAESAANHVECVNMINANHAESIAKIDANKTDTDAKFEKMETKIDANHAATMAMFTELKKMITDSLNSGGGKK